MDLPLLGSAIALCLIFEGLLPFASPATARKAYAYLLTQSDGLLRATGIFLVGSGLVLLRIVGG